MLNVDIWHTFINKYGYLVEDRSITYPPFPENLSPEHLSFQTDLFHQSLISITGPGSLPLLQSLMTINVTEIDNKCHLAALCNNQGRIIVSPWIFRSSENFYLQLPYKLTQVTLDFLNKYKPFYKIEIKDVSNEYIGMGIRGSETCGIIPTEIEHKLFREKEICFHKNSIFILKPSSHRRYEIYTPNFDDFIYYWEKGLKQYPPLPNSFWKLDDLLKGICIINEKTTGNFIPNHLYYEQLGAISYSKGCYIGQEIIARIKYRGSVKSKIFIINVFDFLSTELIGDSIYSYEDKEIGTILDLLPLSESLSLLIATCHEETFSYKQILLGKSRIRVSDFTYEQIFH